MTRSADDLGAGLAAPRAARPIPAGERIHVVGAGGSGASAAALLAQAAGARVSACDTGGPSPYTAALAAAGIAVATEHDAAHVGPPDARQADRLAVTKALTAVDPDHPELRAARAAGIPVEAWQQTVADAAATHGGRLVAVAGTHGKSTTTGWLVDLLIRAGRDPAAFVGALLPGGSAGAPAATARWGRGDTFVVEADEYAGNFRPYHPALAVLLNAEWDHPDAFADDAAVADAFAAWLRAGDAGARTLVVNVGDPGARAVADRVAPALGRVVRVALDAPGFEAEVRGSRTAAGGLGIAGLACGPVDVPVLALPGRHNAENALCVAAAAAAVGVPAGAIATALAAFGGVGRRMEWKGEVRGIAVIDDYGHHPTAIRTTIAAVRERHPGRRVVAVCEPLTYHRTAAMTEPLGAALATADRVVVVPIWASRDPDRTIASAASVAAAAARHGAPSAEATDSLDAAVALLAATCRPGDVVLVMGGGASYRVASGLIDRLRADGGG
ncbi:MAG: glutamate ligase domain-containing protein [Chloroflexota bacterium]